MKYETQKNWIGEVNPNYKHGYDGTPTYKSWQSMKERCYNSNSISYKNYGAIGIEVCERWMVFENFLADMGERPEGMTLDRIDNDGNYEPINCRWATYIQQSRNRKTTRLDKSKVIRIKNLLGKKIFLREIADMFGVGISTIQDIKKGRTWREV